MYCSACQTVIDEKDILLKNKQIVCPHCSQKTLVEAVLDFPVPAGYSEYNFPAGIQLYAKDELHRIRLIFRTKYTWTTFVFGILWNFIVIYFIYNKQTDEPFGNIMVSILGVPLLIAGMAFILYALYLQFGFINFDFYPDRLIVTRKIFSQSRSTTFHPQHTQIKLKARINRGIINRHIQLNSGAKNLRFGHFYNNQQLMYLYFACRNFINQYNNTSL